MTAVCCKNKLYQRSALLHWCVWQCVVVSRAYFATKMQLEYSR